MSAVRKLTSLLSAVQFSGSRFLQRKTAAALFWDVGVGKTLATLAAIQALDLRRVLIVAPRQVAENTWPDEIVKWGADLTYAIATRTAARRRAAVDTDPQLLLTNYENLGKILEDIDDLDRGYDLIVFDELSKMKAPGGGRVKTFNRQRGRFDRVWGLTGSPAANHLMNLWAQIRCLTPEPLLEGSYTKFKREHFYPIDYDQHIWKPLPGTPQWIETQIAPLVHRAPKNLGVELMTNDIQLTPDANTQGIIDELRLEMIYDDVVVDNAAVLCNKLIQVASGNVYRENGGVLHVHGQKVEALKDLVSELQGEPLIVFYNYKHELEQLQEQLKAEPLDLVRWNKGEIPVMALHPGSAGHGLNLQYGGHHLAWFSLPWSLELYEQAIGRLHRQGQAATVHNHRILMGFDHQVAAALDEKNTTQEALLSALSDYNPD